MTQGVCNEPKIVLAHTQVILLHKHQHLISIYIASSLAVPSPEVLQATVGGGEDLGMRLLLCEMYASGKR